jgi:hypothetical protein
MKKLLLTAAIAGLLIGGPAMAQNSDQNMKSQSTTTRSVSKVAPGGERHRTSTTVRQSGERHTMRHRGQRESINVRIGGGGYGYHHRYHRGYAAYGEGCRRIVVKKHYHGRTIIKRTRVCR